MTCLGVDTAPFTVRFRDDNPYANARIGVYDQALTLTASVDRLLDRLTNTRFHLKVHLDRRATAVALHIAHASGEVRKSERRRHYEQALRAVTECAAILDIVGRRGTPAEVLVEARAQILWLVSELAVLATR
ncbi:MAG: four helix bundle protein [Kofleriaceae bacterium]